MEQIISDYVNGHLKEAKRRARRYSLQKLVDGLLDAGHGLHAAYDIANFLKGYGSFQAACDAEHAEKQTARY
jgi:hypothetical protein